MKNATKHADELKSLQKRLMKDHKSPAREPVDALKTLVRAAMSFDVTDARADEAMRLINKEFVDLNELRVATELEVQEMLGQRYPAIERRVAMITQSLNNIFEREHTLSLDRLKTLNKKEARQFLRELPEIHPFVEAYVMLFAFDGHAVPIDEEMLAVLRDHNVVSESATLEEAQKFVESHIKSEDSFDFFVALRNYLSDKAKKKK